MIKSIFPTIIQLQELTNNSDIVDCNEKNANL